MLTTSSASAGKVTGAPVLFSANDKLGIDELWRPILRAIEPRP